MNVERLLKLADFLEKIPEDHFDMDNWVSVDSFVDEETYVIEQKHLPGDPEKLSCGTTACAFGWATALWPEELYFDGCHVRLQDESEDPFFHLSGFSAAREFFGLQSPDLADLFFSPETFDYERAATTPDDVAGRIRSAVELYKNETDPEDIPRIVAPEFFDR